MSNVIVTHPQPAAFSLINSLMTKTLPVSLNAITSRFRFYLIKLNLLRDKSEYYLIKIEGILANTLYRIKKGEPITTKTIDRLCEILECNVEDVTRYELNEE